MSSQIKYFPAYKTYNGYRFARQFPDKWILDQAPGTGTECEKCLECASWRGVLVGYCVDCALIYKEIGEYIRGPGFWDCGVEISWLDWEHSSFDTYLKGISMDKIGDIDFNEKHTFEKYQEAWDYVHSINSPLRELFQKSHF